MSDSQTSDLLEDLQPPSTPSFFTEEELKDVVDDENDEHHENETVGFRRLIGIRGEGHWDMASFSDLYTVPATVNNDVTAVSAVGSDTVCDLDEIVEGGDPFAHANMSNSELCQPTSTTDEGDGVNKAGHQKRVSRKTPLGSRSVEEADPSFSNGGGETSEIPSARRYKRATGASNEESEDEETSAPPPKLFKYQLDTPDAKAAKASKNTRDKKKAELEKAKATIEEQKGTIAYLQNELEESRRLNEEFRQQIESSRLLNQEGPQLRQKIFQMIAKGIDMLNLIGTPVLPTTFENPEASVNDEVGGTEPS